MNLSIWRNHLCVGTDICVGTVRLAADDVAKLVTGLTEGLALLAAVRSAAPEHGAERLAAAQERVTRLETRRRPPAWRRAGESVVAWAQRTPGRRR